LCYRWGSTINPLFCWLYRCSLLYCSGEDLQSCTNLAFDSLWRSGWYFGWGACKVNYTDVKGMSLSFWVLHFGTSPSWY
jgi:hypothetical protein